MIILANVQSDRMAHVFTIYSVLLVLIGFLFLSFEVLGRPEGVLRWLMRVIVPGLIIAIACSFLASCIPSSPQLGLFNLRDIMASLTLYGSLIVMFYGLFTHTYDIREKSSLQRQASNDLFLRENRVYHNKVRNLAKIDSGSFDSFIGLVFASFYWGLAMGLIIFLFPLNWPQYGWPFYVSSYFTFAALGAIGGAYWRVIYRSTSSTATGRSPIFSLQDCLRGAMYWFLICCAIYFISALLFSMYRQEPVLIVSGILLLGTMGLVVGGGLLSGWSQSIVRRITVHERESKWVWFVRWLAIWIITSSIFIALIPTADTLANNVKTPLGFIQSVLIGITITVVIGTLICTIISGNIGRSQQGTQDANFFLFSFLRNSLISLVSWYDIWFVFPVTLILATFFATFFHTMNIAIVLFLGISMTVGSISICRFISRLMHRRRVASLGQISRLSYLRKRAKTLLSWPLMWVSTWVIAVVIFQEITVYAPNQPTYFLPVLLLTGTFITILVGSLVIATISLSLWLADRLHLVSTEDSGSKPPFFSLKDSFIGLVFWPATWLASIIIACPIYILAGDISKGYSLSDPYPELISRVLNGFSPLNIWYFRPLNSLSILIAIAVAGMLVGLTFRLNVTGCLEVERCR